MASARHSISTARHSMASTKWPKGTGKAFSGDRIPSCCAHSDRGQQPQLPGGQRRRRKASGASQRKDHWAQSGRFRGARRKAGNSGAMADSSRKGEQTGTLQLLGPDGTPREVEYIAKTNVLPVRHLLRAARQDDNPLRPERTIPCPAPFRPGCRTTRSSCWMRTESIVDWYAGAERIYGYGPTRLSAGMFLALSREIRCRPVSGTN